MDIKKVYNQLTNVDIEEQMYLWDDRGKGYYGEFLMFCELYKNIPGNCKMLMNLNIPVGNGKTTEIDLLMIHETGFYVFEAKHYKGTIYGNDTDEIWTQYFRTVKNKVFKNPMLQNDYHLKALKKLFPSVPVKSIIVFTNEDCSIKVDNYNKDIELCNLNNLVDVVSSTFKESNKWYLPEEIDVMFETLAKYSQMQEPVLYNGEEKPFLSWMQPVIDMLNERKKEVEFEKQKVVEEGNNLKKTRIAAVVVNIVVGILCVIVASCCINIAKEEYDTELAKFKQNFKHIDEIDNEYIKFLNEYVNVSNVSITELADNAVSFTARLSMNNDVYGIALTKESKYIVMTSSGMTYEYDVFGEHLAYNSFGNKIGKGYRPYGDLARAQFFGVNKNNISYIKITNIDLIKTDAYNNVIKSGLEIELYKK